MTAFSALYKEEIPPAGRKDGLVHIETDGEAPSATA